MWSRVVIYKFLYIFICFYIFEIKENQFFLSMNEAFMYNTICCFKKFSLDAVFSNVNGGKEHEIKDCHCWCR